MKQERYNKFQGLTFIALLLTIVAALFLFNNGHNNRGVNKDVFRFPGLDEVDKIVLQSDDTVALSFNGTYWMVNEKYRADNDMIRVLFATLAQAEPRRAVTGEKHDSIALHLDSTATLVSLQAKDQVTGQFEAGGNPAKTLAYFRKGEEIYIMHIPGYRVYVSGILELDEGGFRDKYVFGFRWENFKGLKAVFPANPESNFDVEMIKDFFTIKQNPAADTTKVYNFLDEVARLTVDAYPKELPEGVRESTPMMELTVEDIASRKYTLVLFPGKDKHAIPALVNGEPALFNFEKVRPIIRPRNFFTKKTQ